MSTPLISVIVPVYNVQAYLEKTVNSLLEQTYKSVEIILINDGSTDGSGVLCDRLAQRDNRVRVIHQRNQGVSATRNNGIRNANGEYLVFVDSDDTVDVQYVQTLYQEMVNHDADLVICGYRRCYPKIYKDVSVEKDFFISRVSENEQAITQLYAGAFLNAPWNKMYKRNLISHYFDSSLAMGEDLVFNLQYLKNIKKLKVTSKVLYYYIVRANSAVTTYKPNRMDNVIRVNQYLLHFYEEMFGENGQYTELVRRCVREVDGVYRYLFRGTNTKEEKIALIAHWCAGEEYRAFCEKYAPNETIFLENAEKLYRYYDRKTWLERKLVKLLR